MIGFGCWLLGLGTVFSFNIWSDFELLPGKTFFDTMDYVSNNIMLPIGGVLIATFTGWILNRTIFDEELSDVPAAVKTPLLLLIRFIAPAGVLVVFVMSFA